MKKLFIQFILIISVVVFFNPVIKAQERRPESIDTRQKVDNNRRAEMREKVQRFITMRLVEYLDLDENGEFKIIGFIDDDCVATSTWIEAAVESFKENHVGGVQGPTLPGGKVSLKDKIFHYIQTSNVSEQNYSYATCNIFYLKKII